MEILRGKHASFIDRRTLAERLAGYNTIHIDIGTGDGRYVQHSAKSDPTCFGIGIDSCRENLQEVSRRAPANTLFVIANALALPSELRGLATQFTVNFPWGSLLEGLMVADSAVLAGLKAIARPHARLDIRLNSGALAEVGYRLEQGAERVQAALTASDFAMQSPVTLTERELKSFPTSWAKRLAFGRDPHAVYVHGVRLTRAGFFSSE